jgi:hypothetical protein
MAPGADQQARSACFADSVAAVDGAVAKGLGEFEVQPYVPACRTERGQATAQDDRDRADLYRLEKVRFDDSTCPS